MKLLDNQSLEHSDVVANSRMNRERTAVGVNSYAKDVGIDPISFLTDRLRIAESTAWLDLCCGRGRALIATARALREGKHNDRVILHGVDLVDMFDNVPQELNGVDLKSASLHNWRPSRSYDLVTCVHGLHYIGDKLSLLERAISWLTQDGIFQANLDLDNLRHTDGGTLAREIAKRFHDVGIEYDRRKHVVSCSGSKSIALGYRYVGADDTAGPNYSGQEAVNSYYEPLQDSV